jgi:hypothetical protein
LVSLAPLEEEFILPDAKLAVFRPALPSTVSLPNELKDKLTVQKIKEWSTWDPDQGSNADRFQDFFSVSHPTNISLCLIISQELRFIIVTHEKEVNEEIREMIARGNGQYECFTAGAW